MVYAIGFGVVWLWIGVWCERDLWFGVLLLSAYFTYILYLAVMC